MSKPPDAPPEGPARPAGAPAARAARGRHAAGRDPAKRAAILDGADTVFTKLGFDAASMDDIARAASVSKATLYVYFADKAQLFVALTEARRQEQWQGLPELLVEGEAVRGVLARFGAALVRGSNSDWSLRFHRIVLGVAERMPDVGREYFENGPLQAANLLAAYLERRQADGQLAMPHTFFAAVQFLELCNATLQRPRLFRAITTPPTEAEIGAVVAGAVAVFMAAYGRATDRPGATSA